MGGLGIVLGSRFERERVQGRPRQGPERVQNRCLEEGTQVPESTPKGGPWGSPGIPRRGPGGVPRGPGGHLARRRFWDALVEGLGPVWDRFGGPRGKGLGVQGGLFWHIYGMFFACRFSTRFGTPFERDLKPNLDPKWLPKSSRKGSQNEALHETA